MEEISKQENIVETDPLKDMGDFFFKSLNDFILFTSGYYYMSEHPPKEKFFPILDNPEFIVEVAAIQTATVSLISSLFEGRLMIPALAIEYFLNNRIQAEMIFNLLKSEGIIPDEENFLRCLSGIDIDNRTFLQANNKVVTSVFTGSSLFARDAFYKTASHILDNTPVGQLNITRTLLNTFLSSVTSYIETRSIAIATTKIYNLEKGV